MHSRSLRTGILPSIIAILLLALAPAAWLMPVAAQDDPEASPPLIEPAGEDAGQGQNPNLLPVQPGEDLGNGGQPEGYPREVTVGEARYLFDRMVPLAQQDLTRIGQEGELIAYARGEEGPFDAVYLSAPPRSEDSVARYLPEHVDAPDTACPAEGGPFTELNAGDQTYLFAGIETDVTPESLQEVGNSNGQPVYADPGAAQPFPELFIGAAEGLLRFVLGSGDGRPPALAESLAFDGAQFAFVADVTGQVDPASLTKAGCAGSWPVLAGADENGTANRFVQVGGRLYQFAGELVEAAEVPTDVPTEAATEEPTEAPTEAPTEVPTEEPTEAPTEVPTEAPTEAPTEQPTEEPTEAPTEQPTEAPTEAPTEQPATEAPAATEAPTEEPAATEAPTEAADAQTEEPAATEAPEGTEPPATEGAEPPVVAVPADVEEAAAAAELPPQIQVQGTTYYFSRTDIDIDIQTLVQVEVITVNNIELTVYATQELTGVAPQLYCADSSGAIVAEYQPAAVSQPAPPASLPPTIEINNTTYVFNEVDVTVNVQNLTQVDVIIVNNVELTVYVEQNIQGQPTRYWAVSQDGAIVCQYVSVTVTQGTAPPTEQLQPPAFVPTQVPEAPPPAAATAPPAATCPGSPGPVNAQGLPTYLPNRIQVGGVAYAFASAQDPGEAGELTRIGCVGAFELLTTDQADRSEVLYLRYTGAGPAGEQVYRFEAAVTYGVEFEVTGRAQVIETDDQAFRLAQIWQPSVYSSTSVILFVANPEEEAPEVFYAVNVANTVVGDVIGEYRLAENETDQPSEGMVDAAERTGLNPDLTIEGRRYLLVNVFSPVGTTTNGFVTLFSAAGEGETELLLGRDKRRLELFVYTAIPSETGG